MNPHLPRWMRAAIKENVLSLSEATELYLLSENSQTDEVQIPEHLWDAVDRINLWEMEPLGSA